MSLRCDTFRSFFLQNIEKRTEYLGCAFAMLKSNNIFTCPDQGSKNADSETLAKAPDNLNYTIGCFKKYD
jgi:hypothetical protein